MNVTHTAGVNRNDLLAIHGGKSIIGEKDTANTSLRWGQPEVTAVTNALREDSLFYWKHKSVKLLTARFQRHCPLEYVTPCSSGTAALHIALIAAGIAPGDEIITSPITDMGTVIGMLYQQGVPVFADLEPYSYNLDPAAVEAAITPRTRAIMAVHLCGNPCDMQALRAIADRHELVLIEDAAQAWGAEYRGRPVGTLGDIACFSFNDFKHVSCGDGGIVASSNEAYGRRLQKAADKGYDRVSGNRMVEELAPCYRMSALQASVAAAQMERVREIAGIRNRLGTQLREGVASIPGLRPHAVRDDDYCSFWFSMTRIDPDAFSCSRDTLVKALQAEGLPCSGGYIAVPLYRYPAFQNGNFFSGRWPLREAGLTDMDYKKVDCPEAEAILETAINIPVNESMDEAWIRLVLEALHKVASHFQV